MQSRATGPAPTGHDPEATADSIVDLARLVRKEVEPDGVLVGVAVGVPGMVRSDGRDWCGWRPTSGGARSDFGTTAAATAWTSTSAQHWGTTPIWVPIAEHLRGAGVGINDLVYLSGEVGVGAGIVVGRSHGGVRTATPERSVICPSTQADGRVTAAHAAAGRPSSAHPPLPKAVGCPVDRIPALGDFLDGVDEASPALREVGRQIGRGLAGIVNLFNPRVIVLGGYLRVVAAPWWADDVRAGMTEQALFAPQQMVEIALPGLGGDAVLLGAAELAFAGLLADPVGRLAVASAVERLRTQG